MSVGLCHFPVNATDLNTGRKSAYCEGVPCTGYANFVENMYEQGLISAPILSFYQVSALRLYLYQTPNPPVQLADGDNAPDGVVSEVAIGGLDRNKYVGSMDWCDPTWHLPFGVSSRSVAYRIPLTNDSKWISPSNARYVSAGDGTPTQDLTSQFARTQLTFDTGWSQPPHNVASPL
jgi:hypothetical protein